METDKLVDFDHVTDYISREAAIDAVYGAFRVKDVDDFVDYWGAIDEICSELRAGRMDHVEPIIRKLICRIFHYSKITNANTGREYTSVTLKKTLDENHYDEYRDNLLAMAELREYSRTTVSDAFRNLIEALFTQSPLAGQDVISKLPTHFMEEPLADLVQEKDRELQELRRQVESLKAEVVKRGKWIDENWFS